MGVGVAVFLTILAMSEIVEQQKGWATHRPVEARNWSKFCSQMS